MNKEVFLEKLFGEHGYNVNSFGIIVDPKYGIELCATEMLSEEFSMEQFRKWCEESRANQIQSMLENESISDLEDVESLRDALDKSIEVINDLYEFEIK